MGAEQSVEKTQETVTNALNEVISQTFQKCGSEVRISQSVGIDADACEGVDNCEISGVTQKAKLDLDMSCIQERFGQMDFKDDITSSIDSVVDQEADALNLSADQVSKTKQMLKTDYVNRINDLIVNNCEFEYDFDQEVFIGKKETDKENEEDVDIDPEKQPKIEEIDLNKKPKNMKIKDINQDAIYEIAANCNQDTDLITEISTKLTTKLKSEDKQTAKADGVIIAFAIIGFLLLIGVLFFIKKKFGGSEAKVDNKLVQKIVANSKPV